MKVGEVIRIFDNQSIPPKTKYFIIVAATSGELATVYINSEYNGYKLGPELQSQQLPIAKDEHKCLKHDSYIDCSEITHRDKGEINSLLQKYPGRNEGALDQSKILQVVDLVKKSKTISPAEKKKFGLI